MSSKNLARRLHRLEERMIPEDEPKVWEIIVVDSDGTKTPSGIRVEMASYSRRRGLKVPPSWRAGHQASVIGKQRFEFLQSSLEIRHK